MRYLALLALAIIGTGCFTTPDSTARQIDRQIKYVQSLKSAQTAAQDAVTEFGEKLDKAEQDLEALKVRRVEEEAATEAELEWEREEHPN